MIVSSEVNKSHDMHLKKMKPYNKCTLFKPIYSQLTQKNYLQKKENTNE